MLPVLVPDVGAVVEIVRAVGVFQEVEPEKERLHVGGGKREQGLVSGHRRGPQHVEMIGKFKVVEQKKRALVLGIIAEKPVGDRCDTAFRAGWALGNAAEA